jgi:hypothetical protein
MKGPLANQVLQRMWKERNGGVREGGRERGKEGRKELWPISDNAFAFGSKGLNHKKSIWIAGLYEKDLNPGPPKYQ